MAVGAMACASDDCARAASASQKEFQDYYEEKCPECGEDRHDWRYEAAELGRDMQATEKAWAKYCDAEAALYVHVFGPSQGADDVRASLVMDLAVRRHRECSPPE
jgi:hypothetical protein